jgi:UDP-glucose 4-epimerase
LHHLILGGCGFIGRHVATLLARAGRHVTLADRSQPDFAFPSDVAARISWRDFEFGSADWDALLANDPVVHLYAWGSLPATANANPAGDLATNVYATLELLEAQRRRGSGRLIFSSSGGTVYGRPRELPVPETHSLEPITAYGAGKATAEVYLGLYRSLYGLDCRIARIANPYGAGQNLARLQGAVTTFCDRALRGQAINIWGDGEVVRDYVYIGDLAAALFALAEAEPAREFIFNVGSGVGRSLNEIVGELERQLGRALDVTRTEMRAFDVPRSVLSVDLVSKVIGWRPRMDFNEGIRRTLADLAAKASFASME